MKTSYQISWGNPILKQPTIPHPPPPTDLHPPHPPTLRFGLATLTVLNTLNFDSLRFVPKSLINNDSALVQIIAWRRTGDKPLSEAMMA